MISVNDPQHHRSTVNSRQPWLWLICTHILFHTIHLYILTNIFQISTDVIISGIIVLFIFIRQLVKRFKTFLDSPNQYLVGRYFQWSYLISNTVTQLYRIIKIYLINCCTPLLIKNRIKVLRWSRITLVINKILFYILFTKILNFYYNFGLLFKKQMTQKETSLLRHLFF